MPALVLAAVCLPAGFGVAELTGVRAVGGVALVAVALLAVWAARLERREALIWGGVVFVVFVLSHVLGRAIGAWPAVALSALVVTAVLALLLRASAASPGSPVPSSPR